MGSVVVGLIYKRVCTLKQYSQRALLHKTKTTAMRHQLTFRLISVSYVKYGNPLTNNNVFEDVGVVVWSSSHFGS